MQRNSDLKKRSLCKVRTEIESSWHRERIVSKNVNEDTAEIATEEHPVRSEWEDAAS